MKRIKHGKGCGETWKCTRKGCGNTMIFPPTWDATFASCAECGEYSCIKCGNGDGEDFLCRKCNIKLNGKAK